jgi:hypothetical protein
MRKMHDLPGAGSLPLSGGPGVSLARGDLITLWQPEAHCEHDSVSASLDEQVASRHGVSSCHVPGRVRSRDRSFGL